MPEIVRAVSADIAVVDPTAETTVEEYLVFVIEGEEFGLALKRVREILSPPPLTVVPRAPRGVMGVCSVRGLLTTVFDLRRLLGYPSISETRLSRVLLIDVQGEAVGLFVDEVRNVLRINLSEIESADAGLAAEFGDHVVGIGRPDGGNVVLIDPTTLVTR